MSKVKSTFAAALGLSAGLSIGLLADASPGEQYHDGGGQREVQISDAQAEELKADIAALIGDDAPELFERACIDFDHDIPQIRYFGRYLVSDDKPMKSGARVFVVDGAKEKRNR